MPFCTTDPQKTLFAFLFCPRQANFDVKIFAKGTFSCVAMHLPDSVRKLLESWLKSTLRVLPCWGVRALSRNGTNSEVRGTQHVIYKNGECRMRGTFPRSYTVVLVRIQGLLFLFCPTDFVCSLSKTLQFSFCESSRKVIKSGKNVCGFEKKRRRAWNEPWTETEVLFEKQSVLRKTNLLCRYLLILLFRLSVPGTCFTRSFFFSTSYACNLYVLLTLGCQNGIVELVEPICRGWNLVKTGMLVKEAGADLGSCQWSVIFIKLRFARNIVHLFNQRKKWDTRARFLVDILGLLKRIPDLPIKRMHLHFKGTFEILN